MSKCACVRCGGTTRERAFAAEKILDVDLLLLIDSSRSASVWRLFVRSFGPANQAMLPSVSTTIQVVDAERVGLQRAKLNGKGNEAGTRV